MEEDSRQKEEGREKKEERARNRKNLIFFLFCFFSSLFPLPSSLFFPRGAEAAVVYLKNGKIMTGRIVEKNGKYLVLKTGEGESEVRTTIFHEDVSRVESEEALSKENSLIPFELLNQQDLQSKLLLPESSIKHAVVGDEYDQQQYIRKLLEERQSLEANIRKLGTQKKFQPVLPEEVFLGKSSVSGTIRLPKLAVKAKGDLYIFLMKETEDGTFLASPVFPYIKIEGSAISLDFVDYDFKDLLEGRYKVMGQWDVALPKIKLSKINSHPVFRNLGAVGDYTGMSEIVILGSEDCRFNVNIDCVTSVKEKRIIGSQNAYQTLEITDIAYKRLGTGMETFVLFMKNSGEARSRPFNFNIKINGETLIGGAVYIQSLAPDEEKAMDLLSCYSEYKNLMLSKDKNVPKELKFVVTESGKEEVVFEKTIVTF